MIPHRSIVEHNPPHAFGDCWRACIASVLNARHVTDVPHFAFDAPTPEECERRINHFLRPLDLWLLQLPVISTTPTEALKFTAEYTNGHHYILGGRSERGAAHTIVARGQLIVHDPTGTGIASGHVHDGLAEGMSVYWLNVLARVL